MKKFSLIGDVQYLINEFNSLNLSNAFTVLQWFYKTIDYNSMFEDKNISSYIYDSLIATGYKPLGSVQAELDGFKKLMNNKENASEIELANGLIGQILENLKNAHSLTIPQICLIEAFNEKYNKQFVYGYMMNNLKDCLGEKIVYTGLKDGEYFIKTGILTYVSDFNFFTVSGEEVNFFSDDKAILTIESTTGKVLFNNNVTPDKTPSEQNIMQFF